MSTLPITHYGSDPGNGGLTVHTGSIRDCLAPGCYLPRSGRGSLTPEEVWVEQGMPVPNDGVSIQSLVRDDLIRREQVGISRYGTSLQAGNGRDALRDLYEELMDATCYIRQLIEERDKLAGGGTYSTSPPASAGPQSVSPI